MSESFSTSLLDEALEKKRRDREVLRQKKLKEVNQALHTFAKEFSFKEIYLFGSLIHPKAFFQESDVDLAIEGLSIEDHIPALSFLSSLLERNVDLVRLEGFRLRDKIIQEGIHWKKPK